MALGASRGRIARAFFTERLILSLIAGALSLILAYGALRGLIRLGPESIPRLHQVDISGAALLFAFAASLISAFLCSFLPALQYGNPTLHQPGTSFPRRARIPHALVALQIAVSLVLLVGAGLMVRSFRHLQQVKPGFDESHALTMQISLPTARYRSPEMVAAFIESLTERLEGLAGVTAAGAVDNVPLHGSGSAVHVFEDFPGEADTPPVFSCLSASPGYLRAMGIPLVEGRWFDSANHQRRAGVVVISESIARKYWRDSSPVGRRIRPGRPQESRWYTIVGVVGDVRHAGLEEEPVGIVYYPMVGYHERDPQLSGTIGLVLRTRVAPECVARAAQAEVWALDPNLPITRVVTLETLVREARAPMAFSMTLLVISSALALALGLIGVYGIMSFVVTQRTREIGIRMALGAAKGSVRRMVVLDGLRWALRGLAVGMIGAQTMTRLMKSLLYEVGPNDPPTVAFVSILLLLSTTAASLVPAARVSRVEPIEALRQE